MLGSVLNVNVAVWRWNTWKRCFHHYLSQKKLRTIRIVQPWATTEDDVSSASFFSKYSFVEEVTVKRPPITFLELYITDCK